VSEYKKFICEFDEIFTYNEILGHIDKDNNDIESDAEKF
jgi:hypothetical protein